MKAISVSDSISEKTLSQLTTPVTYDYIANKSAEFLPRTALFLQVFGLAMNEWSKNIQKDTRHTVVKDPALSLLARLIFNDENPVVDDIEFHDPVRDLFERFSENQFHRNFTMERLAIMLGKHKSSTYRWLSLSGKTTLIVKRLADTLLKAMDQAKPLGEQQIKYMWTKFPDQMDYLQSQGRLDPQILAQAEVIYTYEYLVEQDAEARGVADIFKTGIWPSNYTLTENIVRNGDLINFIKSKNIKKNDAMELFCVPEIKLNNYLKYPDNPLGHFKDETTVTSSDISLALLIRLIQYYDIVEVPYYPDVEEMISFMRISGFDREQAKIMLGLHPRNMFRRGVPEIESTSPQIMLMHHLHSIMSRSEEPVKFLRSWYVIAKEELERYAAEHARLHVQQKQIEMAKAEHEEINMIASQQPESEPSLAISRKKPL